MYHNTTDGYITTSAGDLILSPSTGLVGIGVAPTQALHVNGSILLTGAVYFDDTNTYISGTGGATDDIFFVLNGSREYTLNLNAFFPVDDSTRALGWSGQKFSVTYTDSVDSTDPTSWNGVNCLELLGNPDMWKDRPKDSKYYLGKWTGTIQLDPNTCPVQMQDKEIHRRMYNNYLNVPAGNKSKYLEPKNPDSIDYDPEETGLLINDLVTFNNKALRELLDYVKVLEARVVELEVAK